MTQKEQIKKIIYILELMTKRIKKIEESVLKKENKKPLWSIKHENK
jgi:hypothetical protein|tara:strand:+ start:451 stop:588 length:138 start_codon:yes stop_codon:yes gene_type:complete